MKRRAVFLDRDGVLNRTTWIAGIPRSPATVQEMEILPGVPAACQRLAVAGFLLIVVTNQPDVARGKLERAEVEAMHRRLSLLVPVDDVYVCLHDDADRCVCRKPKPGLLLAAALKWGIDLAASFMIGDRDKDIHAGQQAGCTSILVGDHIGSALPDFHCADLPTATEWILSQLSADVQGA